MADPKSQPFKSGYSAYRLGFNIDYNPYKSGEEKDQFIKGYKQSQKDNPPKEPKHVIKS